MKITGITAQTKNTNRVNILVDGEYRFSLDIFQVGDLGLSVGKEYSEEELVALEDESMYGKLYAHTLEYSFLRPHSAKEIKEYLRKKTRGDTKTKEGTVRKGVPAAITERVFERLLEKGYIDDEKFARHWVESRHQRKGASKRKLIAELRAKGIESSIIEQVMAATARTDQDELAKVIAKKRSKYSDEQKFMRYLARQGFGFDEIKAALSSD